MKYCRVITLFHYGFVTYTRLFGIFYKMAIIYTQRNKQKTIFIIRHK